jgi:hypothetical protein
MDSLAERVDALMLEIMERSPAFLSERVGEKTGEMPLTPEETRALFQSQFRAFREAIRLIAREVDEMQHRSS